MKNKLPLYVFLLLILKTTGALAQELPYSTFYPHNLFSANPAYAATYQDLHAYMNGKNHMVGMDGAPESLGLGLALPFGMQGEKTRNKQALSLRMDMDKRGVFNTFYGQLGFAQQFRLTKNQQLFLGAGLGIINKNLIRSRINMYQNTAPGFFNMGDPALSSGFYNQTHLWGTAGATYRFQEFEANVVLPSLFHYSGFQQKFSGGASYDFHIASGDTAEFVRIVPSAFYHYKPKLPDVYDVGVKGVYMNTAWLQTLYRSNQSLIFAAGVNLDKYLPTTPVIRSYSLGYAYQLGLGNLSHLSSGTHEVMLAVNLNRDMLPEINWFKTESEQLSELQRKNRQLAKENARMERLLKERQLSDDIKENYTANEDEVYTHYFVIVGSFYNERDAKDYQEIMETNTEIETQIIARKDRKYFFIYTNRYETQKEAVNEVNELNNNSRLLDYVKGNIWIYGEK